MSTTTPALTSANSGPMTKLVHGWRIAASRLFGDTDQLRPALVERATASTRYTTRIRSRNRTPTAMTAYKARAETSAVHLMSSGVDERDDQ